MERVEDQLQPQLLVCILVSASFPFSLGLCFPEGPVRRSVRRMSQEPEADVDKEMEGINETGQKSTASRLPWSPRPTRVGWGGLTGE